MVEYVRNKDIIGVTDFYDPKSSTSRWKKNLPHWEQESKIYFVTFRLYDSLPSDIIQNFMEEYSYLLDFDNNADSHIPDYDRLIYLHRVLDKYLDKGAGICCFANKDIRQHLIETLKEGEDLYYNIYDYVIMPNHFHMLIKPRVGVSLKSIISSIKRKSSFRINRVLGRTGTLWQKECFDRICRNAEEFQNYRSYIHTNPQQLEETKYHLRIVN